MRRRLNNQQGFTLVEIIAVLILLGILAAVAVPRYVDLAANAEIKMIQAGIAELNGRENMNWANVKLSSDGWQTDAITYTTMDTDLGTDYTWTRTPNRTRGGTLKFKNTTQALTRTPSENVKPGIWKMTTP